MLLKTTTNVTKTTTNVTKPSLMNEYTNTKYELIIVRETYLH